MVSLGISYSIMNEEEIMSEIRSWFWYPMGFDPKFKLPEGVVRPLHNAITFIFIHVDCFISYWKCKAPNLHPCKRQSCKEKFDKERELLEDLPDISVKGHTSISLEHGSPVIQVM